MTPFRSNDRGTLMLKKKLPGIPGIRRASGTNDPATLKAMKRMLDVLHRDYGRADLVEAVQQRTLHPLVLLERYRRGRLEQIPSADVLPVLVDRFEEWIRAAEGVPETRRMRENALRRLKKHVPAKGAVLELPAALAALRAHMAGHPTAFNRTRSACLAFARDVLGKSHGLYAKVSDIQVLKVGARRKHRPMSAAGLREHMKRMGTTHALHSWSMAITGMGPKEYFADGFEIQDLAVEIFGVKRAGRARLVPRVSIVTHPATGRLAWERRFRVVEEERTPYDLRRTFANLMVEAEIPPNRRSHYMGHGAKSMRELYEQPEIERWLQEDAAALRRVLGEPEPTHQGLRLA